MNKELLKFLIELREEIRIREVQEIIAENPGFDVDFIVEKLTARINEELK